MDYNFLGVAFIADDVPKKKADVVEYKMEEIIAKYTELSQIEFRHFLESQGLESAMGVVIPKEGVAKS
jgi:hypothetical protein